MKMNWPVVLPDGRAGGRERCFYCRAPVGNPHERDCVQVYKVVEYEVVVGARDTERARVDGGTVVGTYRTWEPWHWTPHDGEFHKNDGSWCADNCLDGGVAWNDSPEAAAVRAAIDAQGEGECACGLLGFRQVRVVDPGPLDGQAEEAATTAPAATSPGREPG